MGANIATPVLLALNYNILLTGLGNLECTRVMNMKLSRRAETGCLPKHLRLFIPKESGERWHGARHGFVLKLPSTLRGAFLQRLCTVPPILRMEIPWPGPINRGTGAPALFNTQGRNLPLWLANTPKQSYIWVL